MALVPVPPGVVTLILPVTAPTGTVAVIWVAEFTTKLARTPPNRTAVAPVKAVPVIVTAVPVLPLVGENEEIVGAGTVTVKLALLVSVPPGVVTVILPVVAPVGTFVSIRVPWEFTVTGDALTPLNCTAVAPATKPLPLIWTAVPTGPLFGENEEIVGGAAVGVTVKLVGLVAVPPVVLAVIGPVVAPVGTSVTICVAVFDVIVAITPLNFTQVAPVRLVPLIVTEVPTGPLDGENELMVGSPLASAGATATRPTMSPARARHAETRRGSRPAFISMLPTRAGIRPIVAPERYPVPVRRRKFDQG